MILLTRLNFLFSNNLIKTTYITDKNPVNSLAYIAYIVNNIV